VFAFEFERLVHEPSVRGLSKGENGEWHFRAIFAQEAIVLVDVAITTIERFQCDDAPGVAENAIISHLFWAWNPLSGNRVSRS